MLKVKYAESVGTGEVGGGIWHQRADASVAGRFAEISLHGQYQPRGAPREGKWGHWDQTGKGG